MGKRVSGLRHLTYFVEIFQTHSVNLCFAVQLPNFEVNKNSSRFLEDTKFTKKLRKISSLRSSFVDCSF